MVSRLSSFPSSTVLSTGEATGLLLTKFRTGLSHSRSVLVTVFGLTEIQVFQIVASARKAFFQDFPL